MGALTRACAIAGLALALVRPGIAAEASATGLVPPTVVTPAFQCWRNVIYGPRGNYPGEGATFRGRIGNWRVPQFPWRMATHKSAQHFDVYAPTNGVPEKATVVVFLHGGAWSQPFDKDSVPFELLTEFLARDVVFCSVGYMLQTDLTINPTPELRPEATFDVMLRDVDRALAKLRGVLPRLGVRSVKRLVLMGESAGAHLALAYAYDQDGPSALGLGLRHAFRIDRVVAVAAPVDFEALDGHAEKATASYGRDDLRWKFRMTLRRCLGVADDEGDEVFWPRARRWSPVNLVSEGTVPTILVNGQVLPLVRTDGAIPLAQMRLLERALKEKGVPCATKVCLGSNHGEVIVSAAPWIAEQAVKEDVP